MGSILCKPMKPKGGAFTNQIETKWMCYNCFVLQCMSRLKASLLMSGVMTDFILLVLCHRMVLVI